MIGRCEFDTIYHEHLCYFSLTALEGLFRRHHPEILDAEKLKIHGGSIRTYVSQGASGSFRAHYVTKEEVAWGVIKSKLYSDFSLRIAHVKSALCRLLADLKSQGAHIAAYGVAAKGSTLLNFRGMGTRCRLAVRKSQCRKELSR
jgi:hypothetical protein